MITFFTIIIVMNLIAWLYAKKELKKVTHELDQNKDILKTIYQDRWEFIKRTKDRLRADELAKKTTRTKKESRKDESSNNQ